MRIFATMNITRASLLTGLIVAAWWLAPTVSYAQANRGSTTSGAFGQTTLGSTSGASPSGLGSGMTQGMSGNSTQGGSGANNNGTGGSGGTGGISGPQNLQAGGLTGFIGNSSANNAGPFNATGQRGQGNQNFNQLSQLMTKSRQNQFNAQQAQKASKTANQAQAQFRVPLRLGFQPQPIQPQRFGPIVSTRLTKIPGLTKLGPIEASLENTTVVLRGTVATEADRQLAEGLARLEPEAMAVRNELVVGSSGTRVEALPLTPAASTP
jgi:hypothetical protein